MFKVAAVAIATVVATTPVLAEDHDVMTDETLSIGGWGKVLNQTVFACRLPDDLETHGSLMIQMNTFADCKGRGS